MVIGLIAIAMTRLRRCDYAASPMRTNINLFSMLICDAAQYGKALFHQVFT
jgi:hypothetical protein